MNPVEAHPGTGDLDSLRAAQGLDLVGARDTTTTTTKLTPAARCAVRRAISQVTAARPASVPSGAIPGHWPMRRRLCPAPLWQAHPVQFGLRNTEKPLAGMLGREVDPDIKPPAGNGHVAHSLLNVWRWLGLPPSTDVERSKPERPARRSVVPSRPTALDRDRRDQHGAWAKTQ